MILFCVIIGIIVLITLYLDVAQRMKMNIVVLSLFLGGIPHLVLVIEYLIQYLTKKQISQVYQGIFLLELMILTAYIWIRINVAPFYYNKQTVKHRLRILMGGRQLILYGLYATYIQSIIYSFFYENALNKLKLLNYTYIWDSIISIILILILIVNGILRIICTSKRLNIIKRIIVIGAIWIPIINIFIMIYLCNIAKLEYEHECYKVDLDKTRIDSEICKTKYPLVLIHGVGFRDFKYINYWGRIPKALIRQGATIYYGNQEAFGTVEYNANDIRNKIFQVIDETGCKKVNIIAHSKGGLDARYMASKLGMGKYIASITMISSPHRGVRFVDIACHMPDGIYRFIARAFNKYFRLIGDKNPDFYTATRQFSTYSSRKFNEEIIDVEGIYYQSYASVMKNMFSDYILTIPYILVNLTEGRNDGLVSITSAKWGDFKGVLSNKYYRGISHGDIIDLRRDDYKGFDVVEKYVEIISALKNKGY